ncbi:MAG: hypothetical protein V6Z86_00365 [Hyphomicrobiales bacterium]
MAYTFTHSHPPSERAWQWRLAQTVCVLMALAVVAIGLGLKVGSNAVSSLYSKSIRDVGEELAREQSLNAKLADRIAAMENEFDRQFSGEGGTALPPMTPVTSERKSDSLAAPSVAPGPVSPFNPGDKPENPAPAYPKPIMPFRQ